MSNARHERPAALVTGAARRVGRAVALELARAGCDVHFTFRASRSEASALSDELAALGSRGSARALDLDNPGEVERAGIDLAASLPRLDVLVHNASVYEPSPLASLSAENALRQYRVNALAPLLLSRALAGRLGESPRPGGGAIVAFADIHALGPLSRPRRDFVAYAMSKAALAEMVSTLAVALAPRVRVNAVAPGVVAFPERGHEADAEMQARYLARVPLGRSGTPEDAAGAVRFLALDAPYITGEILRLDGGRWLT
ncbi:MAG: SDR family oxidoreductase [Phycisphaerales bacterium]|nr:SDR family oxidoreductase [Phycisphaerales bacterium]